MQRVTPTFFFLDSPFCDAAGHTIFFFFFRFTLLWCSGSHLLFFFFFFSKQSEQNPSLLFEFPQTRDLLFMLLEAPGSAMPFVFNRTWHTEWASQTWGRGIYGLVLWTYISTLWHYWPTYSLAFWTYSLAFLTYVFSLSLTTKRLFFFFFFFFFVKCMGPQSGFRDTHSLTFVTHTDWLSGHAYNFAFRTSDIHIVWVSRKTVWLFGHTHSLDFWTCTQSCFPVVHWCVCGGGVGVYVCVGVWFVCVYLCVHVGVWVWVSDNRRRREGGCGWVGGNGRMEAAITYKVEGGCLMFASHIFHRIVQIDQIYGKYLTGLCV